MSEPTTAEFMAAVAAFHEVEMDLQVDWVAHNPIQGEATAKVFGYRIAKAVLNVPRPSQDAAGDAGEVCNCGWGGVHDPDNPRCQRNSGDAGRET